ncbi:hypothetical protein ACPESR_29025 [Nocardia testacea]|uniref:hypothetical protein n=1 Tax=Nocardia testacea TaxID=248551 RepID=UPI003C3006B7
MTDGIIRAMREALHRAKNLIPNVAKLRSRPPRSASVRARGAASTVGDADYDLREPIDAIASPGADHGTASTRRVRVVSGLGDDIDDLVVSSRSLSRDIRDLRQRGWTVERGGLDAYTDHRNKKIIVPDAEVIDIEQGYREMPIGPTEMTRHLAQQVEYARRSSLTDIVAPRDSMKSTTRTDGPSARCKSWWSTTPHRIWRPRGRAGRYSNRAESISTKDTPMTRLHARPSGSSVP